ncbi:hypothetical protein ACFL2J_06375 [Candidatus Omnitrophota bacterium]
MKNTCSFGADEPEEGVIVPVCGLAAKQIPVKKIGRTKIDKTAYRGKLIKDLLLDNFWKG